jgi:hypothetical protein
MTRTTKDRFSRRALLKRLGVGAAMLPLIHAERARAATASGFPKRLVTVAWGNGIVRPQFFPPGDELVLGEVLKSLEPWKQHVLLPAGLDMKCLIDANHRYAGHFSYGALLSGTYAKGWKAADKSVDQFIADELSKRVMLPAMQLNLGIAPDGESTSWRAAGQKNQGETDPVRLFNRLFAGRNLSTEQLDKIKARRQSVLDFVNKELESFGTRLGPEDRMKISAHKESIRELEKQLSTVGAGAACATPATPAGPFNMPTRSKVMFELLGVALRCDLTRVATMDVYDVHGKFGVSHSFIGVSRDYHPLAHSGSGGYGEKVKIDSWIYSQVAILVKMLAETQEEGGSALDHSVIMTGNGMCEGADHGVQGIPFLLIGSCGGYFKTGRLVKLGNWKGKPGDYWKGDGGVPHNKLLATLCNAMDVPVQGFGPPQYAGTIPELLA